MRLSKKYSRRLWQRMFAGLALSTLAVCFSVLLTANTMGNEPTVPSAVANAPTEYDTAAFSSYPRQPLPEAFGQRNSATQANIIEFSHGDHAPGSSQDFGLFNQSAESVYLSSSGSLTANTRPQAGQVQLASIDSPVGVNLAVYNNRPASNSYPDGTATGDYGMMADGDPYDSASNADCGLGCPKTWYGRVEALYMERVSERGVSLSHLDPLGLPRLGYETGARFTVGRIRDCLDGYEFRYTGFDQWNVSAVRTGTLLKPVFNIDWFPPGTNLSTFDNAQVQRQYRKNTFHSAELNKRYWGWDVISTYYGLRYLFIDEDYRMESTNLLTGNGALDISATNHMIGPQMGAEFFLPLGRLRSTLKFNGGIFANFAESRTELVNAGVLQYVRNRQQVEFGWLCEVGYFLNLQITQRLSAQAGYELWWLGTTTPTISPAYSRPNGVESIFYHGLSVGGELVW